MLATDVRSGPPAATGETRIWDVETGSLLRSLPGPGEVSSLAWGPDGYLAVAYEKSDRLDMPSLWVWDPSNGIEVGQLSPAPAGTSLEQIAAHRVGSEWRSGRNGCHRR